MAEHVPTILVVEDAVDLAEVLVRELSNLGYQVWHAADGRTALSLHQQHQPDLVILDWMLPQLDGLEVLRTIRQTKSTPVLMLTARSEETDLVVGLELGADDYLTKPFGMRELIARVRALLRRDQRIQQLLQADAQPATEVLRYGDLVLDPHLHIVALRQQELDLTPTEFAILDLLLRNPLAAITCSIRFGGKVMLAAIARAIMPCCGCAKNWPILAMQSRRFGAWAIVCRRKHHDDEVLVALVWAGGALASVCHNAAVRWLVLSNLARDYLPLAS